jgi:hypothetical protein
MSWNGLSSINLAEIEEDKGGQTLAAGSHVCSITDAELSKTKSGKGHRLSVTLTALDGSGYVVDYMNVNNPSEKAQEIGRIRLKTMLAKAGYSGTTPDIDRMRGLKIGVHVVRGEDWVDSMGETRQGGGVPRDSKPYFAPEGMAQMAAPQPPSSRPKAATFDDDIPF